MQKKGTMANRGRPEMTKIVKSKSFEIECADCSGSAGGEAASAFKGG